MEDRWGRDFLPWPKGEKPLQFSRGKDVVFPFPSNQFSWPHVQGSVALDQRIATAKAELDRVTAEKRNELRRLHNRLNAKDPNVPIGLRGGCAPANGEALKEHAKKQQEGAHLLVDAMRTLATRANDAIRNSIADGTVIITSRPFVPKKHNRMRTLFGSRASGLSTPLEDDHILTELDKVLRWPPGNSKSKRRNGSLWDEDRDIAVVTTASLPWMTGTAVNPLLRAAYLSQRNVRVTVVVPWLPPSDQQLVHPKQTFDVPEQQEQYVREWVKRRVGFDPQLEVRFYPSRYARDKCSIVPVGDITQSIPDSRADVAVLEEPEHLNWYHHGTRWTQKFNHVVGVVHTNYLEYARRESNGPMKERALRVINSWVCRAYCDKVVKLSAAVQELPRSVTCWVHGVSPRFIDVGLQKMKQMEDLQKQVKAVSGLESNSSSAANGTLETTAFPKGVYFIGKTVWAKGYTELLQMMSEYRKRQGRDLEVDVYGGGEDFEAIEKKAQDEGLKINFHGPKDHAHGELQDYKVFVNPSLSDVVATTTAEALAMGKFVVVADHPCNEFFTKFRNCITYRNAEEFSSAIEHALHNEPAPLTSEERRMLTWEAATERFLTAAEVEQDKRPLSKTLDWALGQAHIALTGIPLVRYMAGAGPDTLYAPESLESWDPKDWEGGIFDRR